MQLLIIIDTELPKYKITNHDLPTTDNNQLGSIQNGKNTTLYHEISLIPTITLFLFVQVTGCSFPRTTI